MKHFKTKNSYHDAEITGYKWYENDLAIEMEPCCGGTPSEVKFLGVKNKKEIDQQLSQKKMYQQQRDCGIYTGECSIYSIEKTDKKVFTVFCRPPLKIICDGISEL